MKERLAEKFPKGRAGFLGLTVECAFVDTRPNCIQYGRVTSRLRVGPHLRTGSRFRHELIAGEIVPEGNNTCGLSKFIPSRLGASKANKVVGIPPWNHLWVAEEGSSDNVKFDKEELEAARQLVVYKSWTAILMVWETQGFPNHFATHHHHHVLPAFQSRQPPRQRAGPPLLSVQQPDPCPRAPPCWRREDHGHCVRRQPLGPCRLQDREPGFLQRFIQREIGEGDFLRSPRSWLYPNRT